MDESVDIFPLNDEQHFYQKVSAIMQIWSPVSEASLCWSWFFQPDNDPKHTSKSARNMTEI